MTRRARVAVAAAGFFGIPGLGACGDPAPPARPPVCEDMQARRLPSRAQCGATLDFTPVNAYEGEIGSVHDREDAVVLINGSCTGTLIAAAAGPVVVTAGHCVGLGDRALVAFNVEAQTDGDGLFIDGDVIEQSVEPDYALIVLDQLPQVTPTLLTTRPSDLLAVIQHPRGGPKVVAEGEYLDDCGGEIFYADLDTLVGSSGAGVLTEAGHLLGVHTDGDCAKDGSGTNTGWTAAHIVEASAYLQAADLADR